MKPTESLNKISLFFSIFKDLTVVSRVAKSLFLAYT